MRYCINNTCDYYYLVGRYGGQGPGQDGSPQPRQWWGFPSSGTRHMRCYIRKPDGLWAPAKQTLHGQRSTRSLHDPDEIILGPVPCLHTGPVPPGRLLACGPWENLIQRTAWSWQKQLPVSKFPMWPLISPSAFWEETVTGSSQRLNALWSCKTWEWTALNKYPLAQALPLGGL